MCCRLRLNREATGHGLQARRFLAALGRGFERQGASLAKIVEKLSRYLIGWRGYFGICETPSVLRALDQWIRRRLRAIVWKQWKRGRTRFAELLRRGVGRELVRKPRAAPTAPGGSATVPP